MLAIIRNYLNNFINIKIIKVYGWGFAEKGKEMFNKGREGLSLNKA